MFSILQLFMQEKKMTLRTYKSKDRFIFPTNQAVLVFDSLYTLLE
jgi:hypothetical protein